MKSQNKIFYSLLFSLILCYSPILAQESLPDLIERIKPAVVKVIVYDSSGERITTGSGFYVALNKIITNKHVIESAYRIEIQTFDNKIFSIVKKTNAENSDLSLLQSSIENTTITPLVISRTIPRQGDKIVVVGSPLGLSGSISDGLVSAFRALKEEGNLLQITASISPGSSGSPVLDMSGQVVGVATLNVPGGQSLNFAIPSERIISLWGNLLASSSVSGIYNPKPQLPPFNQNATSVKGELKFDGLYVSEKVNYAFEQRFSSNNIRFYEDGTALAALFGGKFDLNYSSKYLDKKNKGVLKGQYTLNNGLIYFLSKSKNGGSISFDCVFLESVPGGSIKCKTHNFSFNDPGDLEERIYQFISFSPPQ
jgi:hypothetical protein